jgi:ABC-type spermidine/putrescine transport system permease subunit I
MILPRVRRAAQHPGPPGASAQPVELLYPRPAILVGLVYTSLLFAGRALVGSFESLDNELIEAATTGGKELDPA